MARTVNRADDYLTKVLKNIPSEIVMAYVALDGVLRTSYQHNARTLSSALWIIALALTALTPLWLWRVMRVRSRAQLTVSTLSVLVWLFAIGGPFASITWYEPALGAVALPLYTLLVPVITGRQAG